VNADYDVSTASVRVQRVTDKWIESMKFGGSAR
jgi:hypothetical protein